MEIINTSKKPAITVIQSKIMLLPELLRCLMIQRFKNNKIVFTNGCFDILHQGHIHYLAQTADEGGFLAVGLNSDDSVKRLGKSANRPLQDQQSRAVLLASLHFVDAVIIFDEDTPLQLIEQLKPDVLVKGADYDVNEKDPKSKKYIIGADVVASYGGCIKTIPYLQGYSTTGIEHKILNQK